MKSATRSPKSTSPPKLALFVGVKAYEKAGGAVLRDLFDDENAGWLTAPALLNRLTAEKLESAAAEVRLEGWKWVEIIPGLDWETLKSFGHAEPQRLPPTAAQQKEIDRLTKEGNAILDEHGDDPDDDEARDRFCEIDERIAELSEGAATWPDDVKANAGTVIGIDSNGALELRRGLIRPEDKAAARKAAKPKDGTGDSANKDDAGSAGLSAALVEELTAHRTAALQAGLADNPKAALVAVVHALALDCLYDTGARSCVKVRASMTYLPKAPKALTTAWRTNNSPRLRRASPKACPSSRKSCGRGLRAKTRRRCWRSSPSAPPAPWTPCRSGAA
jgi:ParB family transcriptional regulator, chromosome partitioning protein